ncbi:MAG: hypothetical protein IKC50_05260, partial [Oscillospiraceae bacterium]|nr:hypothetical protein [Oscillospiraceae bacterium]
LLRYNTFGAKFQQRSTGMEPYYEKSTGRIPKHVPSIDRTPARGDPEAPFRSSGEAGAAARRSDRKVQKG